VTKQPDPSEITALLRKIQAGDKGASDALLLTLYDELRGMARRYFRSERAEHTLQPTALVHEAYMRVADQPNATWQDRAHFLGIAARVMRQVLVDHARRKNAKKRAGKREMLSLDGRMHPGDTDGDVEAIEKSLQKLEQQSARQARIVELRVFAGMSMTEIAEALGMSKRTIESDWTTARTWLLKELDGAS
jgi:RNA polymerase sigma factor (TIGR02999 family)